MHVTVHVAAGIGRSLILGLWAMVRIRRARLRGRSRSVCTPGVWTVNGRFL